MDFETGSAILLTYCTSLHALKDCGHLQPGETLVVLGAAGGVGTSAIEVGKAMGAKVIAAASSEEKLAFCKKLGADDTIDYEKADLRQRILDLTGGKGADVVYDPVGGAYTEAALRATAWRGRLLVIGFASGVIPQVKLNLALLKERSLVGVYWGGVDAARSAGPAAERRATRRVVHGGPGQTRRERAHLARRGARGDDAAAPAQGKGEGGGGARRLMPQEKGGDTSFVWCLKAAGTC
jgi:NADPH2:quinone reductase